MSEHKYKKAVFVCRIVAALSLIAVLVIIIIIANMENWNDNISKVLKVLSQVSWACFLISIIVMATFRQKSKEKKLIQDKELGKKLND